MPYLIYFCLAVFSSAHAALPCAPKLALINAQRDVASNILNVHQVDDLDRKDSKAFAHTNKIDEKVLENRYAGTGDLACAGGYSQANVTLVGDVITTTAHSAVGRKGCGSPKQKVANCKFSIVVDGEKQEYPIKEIVDTGFRCGTKRDDKKVEDWAILRLARKVDSRVKPYRIAPSIVDEMVRGHQLMLVGKSTDWPQGSEKDYPDKPKHYGNCAALGAQNFDFNVSIRHNCDSNEGTSGSAVLSRDSDPILLAVHEGASKPDKDCPKSEFKKGSGPGTNCYYNSATAISGDFKDALEEIQKSEGNESNRDVDPRPKRSSEPGVDL